MVENEKFDTNLAVRQRFGNIRYHKFSTFFRNSIAFPVLPVGLESDEHLPCVGLAPRLTISIFSLIFADATQRGRCTE